MKSEDNKKLLDDTLKALENLLMLGVEFKIPGSELEGETWVVE